MPKPLGRTGGTATVARKPKKPRAARKPKAAAAPKPATSFTPAAAPAAPPPAPVPLTGVPFKAPDSWASGTIYDAKAYLADRLKITGNGSLRVFHHSDKEWGTPGWKTKITMRKNDGSNGQVYGPGFYTSTRPETGYGKYEFQVELPLSAFEGKRIYESNGGGKTMPEGVDILAVPVGDRTWFIFKPESEAWLNRSAIEADFDRAGEAVGWS